MKFDHFPELRRLRAFEAIARLGSLVAASGRLHISQPAVTYLIKELETDFDAQLFERRARGTHLTPTGEILAVRSKRFFLQLRGAIENLAGALRLTCDVEVVMARLTRLQCRALLTVWIAGDIEAAARLLHVRSQAVVRALRSFEQLCGAGFFEHGSLSGALIPEVQEFARRLVLAGQEIESFVQDTGWRSGPDLRGLRVGVLVLAPRLVLADIVERSMQLFPAQSIEIIEGSYEDLVVQLRNGKVDLIFGALRAPPPFDDLVEEALLADPYILACRRDHPMSEQPVTRDMLKGAQFIMPTVGLRRQVMFDFFREFDIEPAQQTYTNWLPSITALLRVSDRLAILSQRQLDEGGGGDLRKVAVQLPYDGRFVGLTTRADWLPTKFQDSFLRMTRETVGSGQGG